MVTVERHPDGRWGVGIDRLAVAEAPSRAGAMRVAHGWLRNPRRLARRRAEMARTRALAVRLVELLHGIVR